MCAKLLHLQVPLHCVRARPATVRAVLHAPSRCELRAGVRGQRLTCWFAGAVVRVIRADDEFAVRVRAPGGVAGSVYGGGRPDRG